MNVLVVGPPRSGTTLLTCLLGSHPQCIAMSECYWCEEQKIVSPATVVVNKLCVPNHVQFEHPPLPTLLRRLLRQGRAYVSRSLGLTVKDWPLGALSIRDYIVERDARLLFMLREPNQTVDSMIRRGGQGESRAAARWAHGVQEMNESYSEYENRIHVVKFSRLLNKTDIELRVICRFMNIEYDEGMTNGYESTPQYERRCIDESVSKKKVGEYSLQDRFPEAYDMYRRLRDA